MNRMLLTSWWIATLIAGVPLVSCASGPVPKGEAPKLDASITHEEIRAKNKTLVEILEQGERVFSTPFNKHDGLGDGPFDEGEDKTPFGSRLTLQANSDEGNGHFLRMNGLDSQTCLECHSILSNDAVPATFAVGGVGGAAANAFPAVTEFDLVNKGENEYVAFNGRIINPPFVFGSGGVELLAKEMTQALQEIAQEALLPENLGKTFALTTHGVNFGSVFSRKLTHHELHELEKMPDGKPMSDDGLIPTNCSDVAGMQKMKAAARPKLKGEAELMHFIAIQPSKASLYSIGGKMQSRSFFKGTDPKPEVILDTSNVVGVDSDLVVRPFGRKGNNVTTRDFDCGALRFHMGMEPVEVVGKDMDHDGDGVKNEITIGQLSSLAIFNTTTAPPCEAKTNGKGRKLFREIGCASCHTPVLKTSRKSLPYQHPEDPAHPFKEPYYEVDLTEEPANFKKSLKGGIKVKLYSDLKRHDMGPRLQETLHEATDVENQLFITARLWGIADTAPYMHDGRATTLTEAIDWHGGEAVTARANYFALEQSEQEEVLTFLRSLHTPNHPACSS
ncbi:di-heme oxidoredictase family protein [Nitrospira sp. M1]